MNGKKHRRPIVTSLMLLAACVLSFGFSAEAQQASADATLVAPAPAKPDVDVATEPKPAPYDIAGVVAQAFKMKKPWQMLSPLAPAKDGNGRENLSWDPDKPEKPKGIILFGIQW